MICVIGGGPAGAACALRLAQLGHEVVLVERAPRGRPHVGESLTPAVLPLLQALGVREAVERAGFLRPRGALVQWEGALRDLPGDEAEAGFQVDRGRFDALLLEAAQRAGVQVLQPATAWPPSAGPQSVSVRLHDGRLLQAEQVVLAHGRRGGFAGRARTAALYAYWEGSALARDPRTRVQSAPQAWYWGAPLPDGSFNAAVFVDAQRCAGLAPEQRQACYRDLVLASPLLAPVLQSRARGPVQVCDATPRTDAQPVSGRVWKVGEAAFSIDPLSSQGVQAALRNALQAAACVHTAVRRPQDAALARAFHCDQVQRTSRRHAQLAAGFHAAAAQRFGTPFWQDRCEAAIEAPVAPLPSLQQRVCLDAGARWQRVGCLGEAFVFEAEALCHPALDSPLAFIGGRPAADWLDAARQPVSVAELLGRWREAAGDEKAVALLASLWRQGVLAPAAC